MAIRGLAKGLNQLGHEVTHLRPRRPTDGGALSRLAYNLRLPGRLRARDLDLLVGFDLDGCLLPADADTPRVACLKGVMADEMRFESGATRLCFRLLSRLERRAARTADRVVVPSRYGARVAAKAYGVPPERLEVVPEGIDFAAWDEALRRSRRSGAGSRRGPRPRVLSVARQYARKNTSTLLEAMARLRTRVAGVELRIVGGGPRLPALRRRAEALGLGGSVTFTGDVSDRDEVAREYAAADVFCLPTLQESFGIVFLEAMAAGLPVVASDAAAVPEVVPPEAGILVDPRDPDALAAGLRVLIADRGRRRRMGEAGRRRARRHTWRRIASRFLEAAAAAPALSEAAFRPTFGAN